MLGVGGTKNIFCNHFFYWGGRGLGDFGKCTSDREGIKAKTTQDKGFFKGKGKDMDKDFFNNFTQPAWYHPTFK